MDVTFLYNQNVVFFFIRKLIETFKANNRKLYT